MGSNTTMPGQHALHENPYFERFLLNHHVDYVAQHSPDAVWAEIPKSDETYSQGFVKVTYAKLANAINGAAHWLQHRYGKSENFSTVAYFGPWDIRYIVLLLGAVKAGFKMIFPSPWYTAAGLEDLLRSVDCTKILVSHPQPPVMKNYARLYGSHLTTSALGDYSDLEGSGLAEAPSVSELLSQEYPRITWERTFEQAESEPLVVLHTSGTTNNPKPIIWTHGWAASFVRQNTRKPPAGYTSFDATQHGTRYMSMMPVFHCGNLFGNLLTAISTGSTVVFPVPTADYTAETFIELLKVTEIDVAVFPPRVVEAIAADAGMLEVVSKKLKYAIYAGGSVSSAAGKRMSAATKLYTIYACTENGVLPTLGPELGWHPERWDQIRFHAKAGIDFQKIGDDSYEAVIVRNPDARDVQPVFKLFPDLTEWRTKDVFSPSGEGSWVYRSRVDDVLHFADGTRFNPITYEEKIREHPDVEAALMFGDGRPFATLLVGMKQQDRAAEQNLDRIWMQIQAANATSPEVARVDKSHVIFTQSARPLPRAYKGTLQRLRALRLYMPEVDMLYAQ